MKLLALLLSASLSLVAVLFFPLAYAVSVGVLVAIVLLAHLWFWEQKARGRISRRGAWVLTWTVNILALVAAGVAARAFR
jgi:hypothetical protein